MRPNGVFEYIEVGLRRFTYFTLEAVSDCLVFVIRRIVRGDNIFMKNPSLTFLM